MRRQSRTQSVSHVWARVTPGPRTPFEVAACVPSPCAASAEPRAAASGALKATTGRSTGVGSPTFAGVKVSVCRDPGANRERNPAASAPPPRWGRGGGVRTAGSAWPRDHRAIERCVQCTSSRFLARVLCISSGACACCHAHALSADFRVRRIAKRGAPACSSAHGACPLVAQRAPRKRRLTHWQSGLCSVRSAVALTARFREGHCSVLSAWRFRPEGLGKFAAFFDCTLAESVRCASPPLVCFVSSRRLAFLSSPISRAAPKHSGRSECWAPGAARRR